MGGSDDRTAVDGLLFSCLIVQLYVLYNTYKNESFLQCNQANKFNYVEH